MHVRIATLKSLNKSDIVRYLMILQLATHHPESVVGGVLVDVHFGQPG